MTPVNLVLTLLTIVVGVPGAIAGIYFIIDRNNKDRKPS